MTFDLGEQALHKPSFLQKVLAKKNIFPHFVMICSISAA